jgi:hypothetical protein
LSIERYNALIPEADCDTLFWLDQSFGVLRMTKKRGWVRNEIFVGRMTHSIQNVMMIAVE